MDDLRNALDDFIAESLTSLAFRDACDHQGPTGPDPHPSASRRTGPARPPVVLGLRPPGLFDPDRLYRGWWLPLRGGTVL